MVWSECEIVTSFPKYSKARQSDLSFIKDHKSKGPDATRPGLTASSSSHVNIMKTLYVHHSLGKKRESPESRGKMNLYQVLTHNGTPSGV